MPAGEKRTGGLEVKNPCPETPTCLAWTKLQRFSGPRGRPLPSVSAPGAHGPGWWMEPHFLWQAQRLGAHTQQ